MSKQVIPFNNLKAQYLALKNIIDRRISKVLEHGLYIMGPEVRELEDRLEEFSEARHCITVSSGTDALLISLMALGIAPGDEVITTPFTFAATAEIIILLGAIPVFVDVELDTCNIDASKIEAAITPKTKAIIPVSLYGQPPDMEVINMIASKYGHIPVIEDGAQSFGAIYKGKKSCNTSTLGCTSFFPSKPLGCYGDGGAIFTNSDELATICREIRVHGQSARYVHSRLGVAGRMDTIQCAVVLAKLERFEWEISRRTDIGRRYNQFMDELEISRVWQRPDRTSVFAQYTVLVSNREAIQRELQLAEIPTSVHYPVALNYQPAYYGRTISVGSLPNAARLAKVVLSIPMSADLTDEQQSFIAETLKSAVAR